MENSALKQQMDENQRDLRDIISRLQFCAKSQSEINQSMTDANETLRKKLKDKEKEIVELKEDHSKERRKKSTEGQKDVYEFSAKSKSKLNQSKTDALDSLQKQLKEKEKEIIELKEDLVREKRKSRTEGQKGDYEIVKNQLREAKQECFDLEQQKLDMETELKSKISKLEKALFEETERLKQVEKRKIDLDNEIINLKQRLHSSDTENDRLRREKQHTETMVTELQSKVEDFERKRHSTITIQMYAAVNRELCERMMNELAELLSTQLSLYGTDIDVQKYRDPPPDSQLPLLVICINASRLGTDVTQALQNVNRSRTLAVIVLHHKEIHALPRQPSEKLLIGSDYKGINMIVDIAYLTGKGIYSCDMNNKSLDRLISFLKSNSSESG